MQEGEGMARLKLNPDYDPEKALQDLVKSVVEFYENPEDEEIRKKLSISVGTLNSLTPYKSGAYNADFTVYGYDLSNVSTDARRQRNQRKRNKMKEDALKERQVSIEEMEDKRIAYDKRKEQEKIQAEENRKEAREWLKKYGFEDSFGLYQKVMEVLLNNLVTKRRKAL